MFTLSAEQLALIGEDGKTYQIKGSIVVSIGDGQPGVNNKTTRNVWSKQITVN